MIEQEQLGTVANAILLNGTVFVKLMPSVSKGNQLVSKLRRYHVRYSITVVPGGQILEQAWKSFDALLSRHNDRKSGFPLTTKSWVHKDCDLIVLAIKQDQRVTVAHATLLNGTVFLKKLPFVKSHQTGKFSETLTGTSGFQKPRRHLLCTLIVISSFVAMGSVIGSQQL